MHGQQNIKFDGQNVGVNRYLTCSLTAAGATATTNVISVTAIRTQGHTHTY